MHDTVKARLTELSNNNIDRTINKLRDTYGTLRLHLRTWKEKNIAGLGNISTKKDILLSAICF